MGNNPVRGEATRRGFMRASVSMGVTYAIVECGDRVLGNERKRGEDDLVAGIERVVIWNGRAGGTTWFHPRACMAPADRKGDPPIAVMTLQSISGSDYFGPVHGAVSTDRGKTWSNPVPIPALGRRPFRRADAPADMQNGVCDVVPEYHAKTGVVLAMGHNVYYSKGRLARPQLERYPVYTVRSADGTWSLRKKLVWKDPRGSQIYTCGCGQRVVLDDGDILVPMSFGPKGQTDRMVCTALCAFDGETVTVRKVGNTLSNGIKRGLLEPSIVRFGNRFFMTIRAEDDRGYVSASKDGLTWATQRAWCWDDGQPLTMSTTQQHWLPHSDRLYLVYTRKAKENVNVMRWRAPLYMAAVDTKTLRLIRSTEQVVLPMIGDGVNDAKHVARMGNFHTTEAGPNESWVTVGETLPYDKWQGDVLLARIRWARPNRRVAER